MPIMDGYQATHTIRHRQPYANQARLKGIPIVAMTASAIQGDREKCKRAGMDDYLAKPVQGKILEKMLVKWSIEAKKDRRKVEYHQDTTNSSITDEQPSPMDEALVPSPIPIPPPPVASEIARSKSVKRPVRDSADTRHKRTDYTSVSAFAKSSETENASVARRVAAEEKAIELRDEKLLSMATNPRRPAYVSENSHHAAPAGPSHALTRENISKFEDEQEQEREGTAVDEADCVEASETVHSSLMPEGATSVADTPQRNQPPPPVSEIGGGALKPPLLSRPTIIGGGKRESDRTVTPGM